MMFGTEAARTDAATPTKDTTSSIIDGAAIQPNLRDSRVIPIVWARHELRVHERHLRLKQTLVPSHIDFNRW